MRKSLIVLLGPTGVGKTELSLRLAEHLSCPILSADSRQLYRDMVVGTAAPTPEQLARVQHYFVGSLALTDYYSAACYEEEAIADSGRRRDPPKTRQNRGKRTFRPRIARRFSAISAVFPPV